MTGFYLCSSAVGILSRELATILLSILWSVLAFSSSAVLFRLWQEGQTTPLRVVFLVQLFFISLMRCLFLVIIITNAQLGFFFYVLWSLPAVLLFSTFALLVWLWADHYHSWLETQSQPQLPADEEQGQVAATEASERRKRLLVFLNIVAFCVQGGLYLLEPFDEKLYLAVQPVFLSVLATLAVTAYLLYSCLLLIRFRRFYQQKRLIASPSIVIHTSGIQKRIGLVAGIVCVTFAVRAIINWFWVSDIATLDCTAYWQFFGLFYTGVELIPTMAVFSLTFQRQCCTQTTQPLGRADFTRPLLSF
jgi:hypothetical protein